MLQPASVLSLIPGLPQDREPRAAEVDGFFAADAPWVPYGTRVLSTFVSRAVDFDKVVFNPVFGAELTSFQFKSR